MTLAQVEIPGLDQLKELPPEVQIIGIFGILSLLLIRVVLVDVIPKVRARRNGNGNVMTTKELRKMAGEVHEMREAHLGDGTRDPSGHLRWLNKDEVNKAALDSRDHLKNIERLLEDNLRELRRAP